MIIQFLLFLSLTTITSSLEQKNFDEDATEVKLSMEFFLYDAIADGLNRDKITTDLAKEVIAMDSYFIGKCNICKTVKKAFNSHTGYSVDYEMTGQMVNLKKVKEGGETGKFAIKEAVKTYLDYHFEKSNLGEKQKEAILAELIEESDKGLSLAKGYSFCPSCKGTKGSCAIN